jgi:hypothetical protein
MLVLRCYVCKCLTLNCTYFPLQYTFTTEGSLSEHFRTCAGLKNFSISGSGLPNGIFANLKLRFGYIFVGLEMGNGCIFMAIWYILGPFGIF